MLSNNYRRWLAVSCLILCAGFAASTLAQNRGEVIFAEDFESNDLSNWLFVYSTGGLQSGAIDPPGAWSAETVDEALEGSYSARLTADCLRHGGVSGPWSVCSAINRIIGLPGYLFAKVRFDNIQGSGGIGASWFRIAAFSAADHAKSISYGFSTTGDLGGDIKYVVHPGDEFSFKANIAQDYQSRHGEPIPDDMVLCFVCYADFAEGGDGRRTTIVRLDRVIVTGPCACSVADFDGDYSVNIGDLQILASYWLEDEPLADIFPPTGDEIVNIMDFSKVAKDWAKDCRLADLEVAAILTDPPQPYLKPGQTEKSVKIEYRFSNRGQIEANNVRWRFYHCHDGQRTDIHDFTLQTVTPGETVTRSCGLMTLVAGNHDFTLELDPDNTIEERNEANNVLTCHTSVIPPVAVAISQNPSTGRIPLKIDFTAGASGGLPPYDYAWLIDGQLTRGLDTISPIFSADGAHIVEVLVADSTTPDDFTFQAHNWVSFNLQDNSATQEADLAIPLPPQVTQIFGSANSVEIRATVSNLQPVAVNAVRVQISVQDRDNPSAYDKVFYDDLIAVSANGSHQIVTEAANLPPANYSAWAKVNLFSDNDPRPGAVPESNYYNNGNKKDFTITGQGYFPFVVVDDIIVQPAQPYPRTSAQVNAVIKNFDIYRRFVQVMFYYFDESNNKVRFAHSDIEAVEPGGSNIITRTMWSVPPQTSVKVQAEVVGKDKFDIDHDQVLATNWMTFGVRCFRFSVDPHLMLTHPSYIHDAAPLSVTARVKNESAIMGDVACYLEIDGRRLISVPLRDIPAGSYEQVEFVLSWSGDTGVRIRVGELTAFGNLPKPIVGGHHIVVGVESIEAGKPYADLFYCGGTWDRAETDVTIPKGPTCRIGDVVMDRQPVLGEPSVITCQLTNTGQVSGHFDFFIRCGDTVVAGQLLSIGPGSTIYVPKVWVADQAGPQILEISCGEAAHKLDVFVNPQIRARYGRTFGQAVRRGQGEFTWLGDEHRLKYWVRAAALAGASIAGEYGIVYAEFEIDDGTGAANRWEVDLTLDGGAVGLINIANISVAESFYEASLHVGLTDLPWTYRWLDECKGWPYCAMPCRTRIWGVRYESNVLSSMASGALGVLTKGASDVLLGVADRLDCEVEVLYDELQWGFRSVKVENGRPYRAFIALDTYLIAAALGTGVAEVYADFYYHEPHWCDENGTLLPKRGIWIDTLTVRPRDVTWAGE